MRRCRCSSHLSQRRNDRNASRGQALPLIVFALGGVLGVASLAIDLGFWRYQQRVEQTAADAAAIAAVIEEGYSPVLSDVTSAARTASSANGFTDSTANTTVTVNKPPLTGNYTADGTAVEVVVNKQQPAFFGGIFGISSQHITARAVAIASSANTDCIYALDTVGPSLTLNGATITMPHCGIISNGSLLFHQGSVDAAFIGYATPAANNTVNSTAFPHAQPKPSVAVADPCGSIPGCAYLTANPPTSGSCNGLTTFGSGTVILAPGRYCNTLIFNNSSKVVFNPGVYDLENGLISNNALEFDGTGVTFYIKGGNWIFNGSPAINFSAPTSGNTQGVLMFQPSNNTTQFHVNSGSSPGTGAYGGLLYFPGTTMIIDGKYSSWTVAVAKDIVFNQGGTTTQSNSGTFARAALAE